MKFRNMILVLTITFSAIFVSMLGTSYAYYIATDGTTINITTSQIDTGTSVVFKQSQYINFNTGIPISSTDVDKYASKSEFIVTPDSELLENSDVMMTISLIDVYIADALRVPDFKYKFTYSNGNYTNTITGNGTNFTDDVVSSGYLNLVTLDTTNGTFDANSTYTCTLIIWLEESGEEQNHLMNKKFRGLIKVNTLFTK